MNTTQGMIDWHGMLVPTGSLLELIVRASIMYLLILAGFRIFRRDAGSLSVSDLLVVVLIADAAQNSMAGEYKSLTEGAMVVTTIFAWNYALDWLAYRLRFVHWLLHPPPLLLVRNGQLQRRNLRAELITKADLLEQLRAARGGGGGEREEVLSGERREAKRDSKRWRDLLWPLQRPKGVNIQTRLDLRASKVFRIGGQRDVQVNLDVLNASNANYTQAITRASGPTYGQITLIPTPLTFQVGAQFSF